jgi:hypothetical protein
VVLRRNQGGPVCFQSRLVFALSSAAPVTHLLLENHIRGITNVFLLSLCSDKKLLYIRY